jgi:DNA-binding response OmpR family regulator
MYQIALIEDHARLAELIRRALRGVSIHADVFPTIEAAWAALREAEYDALVIDRGLPDGDGLVLVKRLRAVNIGTPCLILTSRDALRDRFDGLESGADDYVTKPFPMGELVSRVQALMRQPAEPNALHLEFGDIRLYPDEGLLACKDDSINLSSADLQIMWCLVHHAGRAVRRSALQAAAWGVSDAPAPNALDQALQRLRLELLAIGSALQIVDIRNHGHALRDDQLAP